MIQAALIDSIQDAPSSDHDQSDLSIAELDQRLEQAVQDNERSERLICDCLLAMVERRGFEKFGFCDIYYYAEGRFGFSPRKTRYLLHLAQALRRLPRVKEALAQGRLGWTKASRIARVATTEDEAMWLDSALSSSVRELDRMINEQRDAVGVKLRAWLSQDQAAVWENALEVCRRMSGEDLEVGRCLELIAGDFLATYAYLAYQKEENACCQDAGDDSQVKKPEAEDAHAGDPGECEPGRPAKNDEETAALELRICPDDDTLPSPIAAAEYGKTWREVLERDRYRCQYPDCGNRSELHVHHIIFRSHSGKKGRRRSNSPENLVTVCVFHHRMIHAGTIGVTGQAPSQLSWRRPELMESLLGRYRADGRDLGNQQVREPAPAYAIVELVLHSGKRFPRPRLGSENLARARFEYRIPKTMPTDLNGGLGERSCLR